MFRWASGAMWTALLTVVLVGSACSSTGDPASAEGGATAEKVETSDDAEPTAPTASETGEGASAVSGPSARYGPTMVDVPGELGIVLIGGVLPPPPGTDTREAWSFSRTAGWVQLEYPDEETPLDVAYDVGSDRIVWDTATYDPVAKLAEPITAKPKPTGTACAQLSYDAESDRVILFGGLDFSDDTFSDETWAYDVDSNTWTKMDPAVSPPARNCHVMEYDGESDRVILFGGGTFATHFDDTWAYDFNTDTWTELSPANAPPPRSYASMAYDAIDERMILFGGVTGPTGSVEDPLNDTWAFDPGTNTWTELTAPPSPDPRGWHAMAYEADDGIIVLFGGGPRREEPLDDTWIFDVRTDTWSEIG